MEFLQKVIQLYAERKEWFLDLFAAHVGLALTAAVSAGIIGLLLGIFISEHKKAAGPRSDDRKYRLYDSGDLTSGNADPGFGDRR